MVEKLVLEALECVEGSRKNLPLQKVSPQILCYLSVYSVEKALPDMVSNLSVLY